jgi:hypothetical protein
VRRAAWGAAASLFAAGIALSAVDTVRAARRYAAAPALADRVAAEGPRGFRLAAEGGPLADAAGPGRAVIFVYAAECGPSRDNMWNWIDAVRAARDPGVRFLAVAPSTDSGARGYWAGLADRVAVTRAEPEALGALLRVSSTPATVLVENGRVQRTYLGPLTPAARRAVLRFVAGGSPGRPVAPAGGRVAVGRKISPHNP